MSNGFDIRKIFGVILIIIGLFFCSATINSINDVRQMGGPMAISFFPLPELFLMAIGLMLLQAGAIISKMPIGKILLLLAIVSFGLVIRHLWLYPTIDGAYYISRFGIGFSDKYIVPDTWQHVLAFACTGTCLFFGITITFPHIFSDDKHSLIWQSSYDIILTIISVSIVLFAGWIYGYFCESLMSGTIPQSQIHVNIGKSCYMPIGLIILSFGLKKYSRLALILMISGSFTLLLEGITICSYDMSSLKSFFWDILI